MIASGSRGRRARAGAAAAASTDAEERSAVRERSPSGTLRADPDRDVRGVNSGADRASNRLARQAEAEQDRALIQQAKEGDAQAFRRLVERHQRRAFAIAVALVQNEQDAREVVQEAFLRVYRGLDRFNGSSSFFTWLYRIVTNLSIDFMRRPVRREEQLEESRELTRDVDEPLFARFQDSNPALALQRSEMARRIERALQELPPYHRGVILMREIEGMSYEEMAQAMSVSKGTIMSRLFHARQKLQRALADCYEEQLGPRAENRRGGS